MAKIELTGGAYQARSVIASAQRCLNLFPERIPYGTAIDPRAGQGEQTPVAHYPTPGLRPLATLPQAPVRGVYQASNGNVYAVAGSGVYSVNRTTWAGTLLGSITGGLTTPVSMADNGLDLLIVDGSATGWDVTLTSNTFTPIPSTQNVTTTGTVATTAITAGVAHYASFTAPFTGVISTIWIAVGTGYTGQLQAAMFADASGVPGDTIGLVANVLTNPASGPNMITFATPIQVTAGTRYWVGVDSDTTAGSFEVGSGTSGCTSATTFFDFPVASPATTPAAPVGMTVIVTNDPDGFFVGADRVEYVDGFFVLNKPGTPQFYISGYLSPVFSAADYANKESASDLLVVAAVAKREIYLIGNRTTEVWYDVLGPVPLGTSEIATFPFSQIQGVFIDTGVAAKYSVARHANTLFWLSRDREGQGIVVQATGYEASRISTFAIENEIAGYATITDAIGFCYSLAGHIFYALTFPTADHTWAYDISTGLWHEWAWTDTNGNEHRHRANCCWPCDDTLIVGDWQTGHLYALDRGVFTDNGAAIKRVRAFPHIVNDAKRIFYREFIADLETGTVGANPISNIISLDYSNDRGHSFGNPITHSFNTGEYLTSLQWQRLGMSRDRVFRISWTINAPTALQGCWITAEPGDDDTPGAQLAKGQG